MHAAFCDWISARDGELVDAALGALSDATTKGDRLQISYVPAVVPGAVVPEPQHKLPFSPPLKIISRHWHERPVQVAVRKRPGLKNEALVLERRLLLDTNACTSSGLDRLKQIGLDVEPISIGLGKPAHYSRDIDV